MSAIGKLRAPASVCAALSLVVALAIGAAGATATAAEQLVFVTSGDGGSARRDIAVVNPDGTGFRHLTTHSPRAVWPEWTTDGRGLLFWSSDDDRNYNRWWMSSKGTSFRQLPPGIPSPSGRWVAHAGDRGIEILTAAGRKLRTLALPSGALNEYENLVWSHDERTVALTVSAYDRHEEWLYTRVFLAATSGKPRPRLLRPRRVGQVDIASSWSPDDRALSVDTCISELRSTIVLVRPAGGRATLLVADATGSTAQAWSPDSRQIAFLGRDGSIRTVRTRDGHVRRLARATGTQRQRSSIDIAWSRRDGLIAFSDSIGIHTVRADGTRLRRITRLGALSDVDWSPERRRLVFADHEELFTVGFDGRRLERLTDATRDESPVWSPDHSRIAFVRDPHGRGDPAKISVFVMAANGSGAHRVGRGYGPVWAQVGHRLAYVDGFPEDPDPAGTTSRIMAVDLDAPSAQPHRVDVGTSPAWSPDGSQLAYVRYTYGTRTLEFGEHEEAYIDSGTLSIANADGSGRHELLSTSATRWRELWPGFYNPEDPGDDERDPPVPYSPSWSPDGRSIAVESYGRTVLVDVSSDRLRMLSGWLERWSPGGDRLLGTTGYPDALVSVDVTTGRSRTLDPQHGDFTHHDARWSPDGTLVAFVGCVDEDEEDCDVYVIGADGSGLRQITKTSGIQDALDW